MMTEQSGTPEGGAAKAHRRSKRDLDAIFGDVLPETTKDEREPERRSTQTSDEWFREQRPPHHGG